MRLLVLCPSATPDPTSLQTPLKEGVLTKRHEFVAEGTEDAFVVFEGEEQRPFWRREGDGIRFVFTDLTYEAALATSQECGSFLRHTVHDSDGDEFLRYYREAFDEPVW